MNYSIATETVKLSNGADIACYDSKVTHGKGVSVVLLHGYCGSSAYWERIVGPLSDYCRVIAPDARGHGLSSAPLQDIGDMEAYADELDELLERLEAGRVIVLGHSFGGYVALAYAERYGARLAAFGLAHSTPLPDSEEARLNREVTISVLENDGVEAFVGRLAPKLIAENETSVKEQLLARIKEIGSGTSLHGALAAARGMKRRADRSAVISGTDKPVLLIAGSRDGVIAPASTFAAVGGNTRKVELELAGHMGMLECPEAFLQAVTSFIDNVVSLSPERG